MSTSRKIGALAVAAAIGLLSLGLIVGTRPEDKEIALVQSAPIDTIAVTQPAAKQPAVSRADRPKFDYVIDLNTGVTTPLPKAIIRSAARVAWYAASPDGSRLAYVGTAADGSRQIFVADIDGTGIRQVTDDPARASTPAWSPDGTKIAYGGSGGLHVLDVATGSATTISGAGGPWAQSQFTPDGSSLLYTDTVSSSFAVLRTVPVDGGRSTILIGPEQGMGYAGNGSLSPDGSLVTMRGHEFGGPGAIRFVSNVDGTERRHIPEGSSNPAGTWSPDGGRIVCSDYSGKNILVVDVATGSTSPVAKGRAAIWLDRRTLLVDIA